MRRTRNWTVAVAAAGCLATPAMLRADTGSSPARTSVSQDESKHARQEYKQERIADPKAAKKELESARTILDQITGQRLAGVSSDAISQLKSEFTDLYNDYNKTGGKASNRQGKGFGEGSTPNRGDWKDDFARLERRLDDMKVPGRRTMAEGQSGSSVGTSGQQAESGSASGSSPNPNDLAKFRARLNAFYAAASGSDDKR